jgi:benzoylformate decarboxylase
MAVNTITGRSAFLALLKDEGITHLFGNPGTTELPIMHALADHPDLNYVLGLQESLVVTMADGFSRASGKLVSCNVHVAPGLGNAMGALYNAKFTGTPMILTAGQQEQGHGLQEPLLYDPLVPIAAPLCKWAIEVTRLADLPRIVRRAAKIAMTPPTGPVFISLPGDILNAEAGLDLGRSSRVESRVLPAPDLIEKLADMLIAAERPLIVAGDEIVKSDALEEAALVSEALGAPAWQNTSCYGSHFLSERPCYMGTLARDQKFVRGIFEKHDLVLSLGADLVRMSVHSETEPVPETISVVQVGLVDWELAKNFPATLALKADVRETIRALLPVLKKKGGARLADRAKSRIAALAETNWTAKRKKLVADIGGRASSMPMDPDFATLRVAESMDKNSTLVFEGLTTARYISNLLAYRERYDFVSYASGGIGWSVPAAVGVALAQPDKRIVCMVGDGSAMYSIQALWTAAHKKLPITYVICNNGGYRIIKQRLLAFHGSRHFVAMDFKDPAIDFVGMAQSYGVEAMRVDRPDMLADALAKARTVNGPVLIDVVVDGKVG